MGGLRQGEWVQRTATTKKGTGQNSLMTQDSYQCVFREEGKWSRRGNEEAKEEEPKFRESSTGRGPSPVTERTDFRTRGGVEEGQKGLCNKECKD